MTWEVSTGRVLVERKLRPVRRAGGRQTHPGEGRGQDKASQLSSAPGPEGQCLFVARNSSSRARAGLPHRRAEEAGTILLTPVS